MVGAVALVRVETVRLAGEAAGLAAAVLRVAGLDAAVLRVAGAAGLAVAGLGVATPTGRAA